MQNLRFERNCENDDWVEQKMNACVLFTRQAAQEGSRKDCDGDGWCSGGK